MYDGGVRRGWHVLMALRLGASFVFVGRPMLFAAAVAGEPGVRHAIRLLAKEVSLNLAVLGVPGLEQLSEIDVNTDVVSG
jgi:L-lactate dehydrogenase (cytochrome)